MQKHVNLVDLVRSFPTHILLQNLALIQRRTRLVKFARSPRTDLIIITDPPGLSHDPDVDWTPPSDDDDYRK